MKNKPFINYLPNLIIYIVVIIIFLVLSIVVWKAYFFSFYAEGHTSDGRMVAASITLIGGLFGSIITLFGLVLKYSIDRRSIAIQESAEARANEAERRLKVEAAIQSINLLSTSAGEEVPDIQKAGVILSLGNLEMFAIALALSDKMMQSSSIDTSTFCWLVDKAMENGSEEIKLQVVLILSNYLEGLGGPNGSFSFPSSLLKPENFKLQPDEVRANIVDVIIELVTMRPFKNSNPDQLAYIITRLYKFWKDEKKENIKTDCGIALFYFINKFQETESDKYNDICELETEFSIYNEQVLTGVFSNTLFKRMDVLKFWLKDEID